MGCASYTVYGYDNGGWNEVIAALNYDHPDFPCLCTFDGTETISREHVRSMAALGALVALVHNGFVTGEYAYAPSDLPERVVKAIEYFVNG